MYHAVGTQVEGDVRALYNISPARFKSHMKILATHYRKQIKPLDEESLRASEPGIMVTFDDGYIDNLTCAAPLLVELGIPFTVFVTTEPVMVGRRPMMNSQELRELDTLPGVKIGAQGVTHARLAECNDQQIHNELYGSKSFLEDVLQHPIDALSYPHGSVNQRVRNAAAATGFRIGATSRFDCNTPERDPLLLCRTDIWSGDSDAIFKEKLAGDWDWRRWRHPDPAKT